MQLFNEQIMQAICWTLVHSLWQGLLLAVVAGAVMLLTKKSSAALRYNILAGLFFLFIAIACITFLHQYDFSSANNNDKIVLTANNDYISKVNITAISPITEVRIQRTFLESFTDYFNTHATLIVTIWFVVLSAQLLRLIANAVYIQRIKHYRTHPASAYWKNKLQQLAVKLRIHQRVMLLESEMVKVPVMVGFLKPVILFPFQLMSQLPAEQVEAVLLHELAHIRRKDYLMNLLQNFAEVIFFFNPAVLWISSLIRDERENCCDDIAVEQTKSKKEFVHVLVSFQEYKLSGSKYALAFPGKKNHLLNRVKRILTNNNKTLNTMEKISLASGIIVIGLITIAFKQNTIKKDLPSQAIHAKEIKNDTVPDKNAGTETSTYNLSMNGKKYEFTEVNGKVTELFVEGKKIPDEKIKDYREVIDKFHTDMKKQQDEMQAQKLLEEKQRAEMEEQAIRMEKEKEELAELQRKSSEEAVDKAKIEKQMSDEKLEQLKRMQESIELEQSKKANEDLELQLRKQNEELMILSLEMRKRQEEVKMQIKSLQPADYRKQNELLNKQIQELKNEQLKIQEQRLKINKIISEFDRKSSLAVPANPVQVAGFRSEPVNPAFEPIVVNGVPLEPQQAITFKGNYVSTTTLDAINVKGYPVKLADNNVFGSWPLTNIIDELVDQGIITDKENLELKLNNEVLMVNGIRQPEELHTRLKNKYLKNEDSHVIYSQHGHAISGDIKN